jgi:hypothetical protein
MTYKLKWFDLKGGSGFYETIYPNGEEALKAIEHLKETHPRLVHSAYEEIKEEEAKKPIWRIVWKQLDNGYTGYGEPSYTRKVAEEMIKRLNAEHTGAITHWVQHENEALPQN